MLCGVGERTEEIYVEVVDEQSYGQPAVFIYIYIYIYMYICIIRGSVTGPVPNNEHCCIRPIYVFALTLIWL